MYTDHGWDNAGTMAGSYADGSRERNQELGHGLLATPVMRAVASSLIRSGRDASLVAASTMAAAIWFRSRGLRERSGSLPPHRWRQADEPPRGYCSPDLIGARIYAQPHGGAAERRTA